MRLKLALFGFLSTLFCHSAHAQNRFHGDYLPFGLGGSYEVFLDEFNSPLSYSGFLGQIQSGYISQSDKWQNTLYLSGGLGFQKPDVNRSDNDSRYLSYIARLHYSLRYRIFQDSNQAVFVGLVNQNTWDYRDHNRFRNSSETFSGWFSYGLSASYQWQFDLKFMPQKARQWGFQFDLNLPVGSYVLRPAYVNQLVADEVGFKENLFWADFFHLNTQSELIWFLDNGNQIRLSYRWDYAQVNLPNLTMQADHQLFISTYFRF